MIGDEKDIPIFATNRLERMITTFSMETWKSINYLDYPKILNVIIYMIYIVH